MPIPVVDSHIHLFPESELSTLAWTTPDHPLYRQCSVDDYREAAHPPPLGFVFLETDRQNNLSTSAADGYAGWADPLTEIAWLARIVSGTPRIGEGHGPHDSDLCLGIVPWAPVHAGADALDKYVAMARQAAGPAFSRIKGFRFLLQDKPDGTMLADKFIGGLQWLGRHDFVFDLGVDQHRRGAVQLGEAIEMMQRAHAGVAEENKVTFIISKPLLSCAYSQDHLCKPDFTSPAQEWRAAMATMAAHSKTYIKLSGGFSEMSPAQLAIEEPADVYQTLRPWIAAVMDIFGPERVMFGSDWPVCTVGGGEKAWTRWRDVVAVACSDLGLTNEEQHAVWHGTAERAYGLGDDD